MHARARTVFIAYLSIASPLTACATFDSSALGGDGDEFDDADAVTNPSDTAALVFEDGDRPLPDSADASPSPTDTLAPALDTAPPLDTKPPPIDTTAPPPDTTPPPLDTAPPPADTKPPPAEVGSPGTPGTVKCGGPPCNITTHWCVYNPYDPIASPYCGSSPAGYPVKCDEKADCVVRGLPSSVCCKGASSTDCVASCAPEKTLP